MGNYHKTFKGQLKLFHGNVEQVIPLHLIGSENSGYECLEVVKCGGGRYIVMVVLREFHLLFAKICEE